MASKSTERKTPENFAKEATNPDRDENLTEGKRSMALAAHEFQRNSGNISETAGGDENAISCLPLLAWQGAGKNKLFLSPGGGWG